MFISWCCYDVILLLLFSLKDEKKKHVHCCSFLLFFWLCVYVCAYLEALNSIYFCSVSNFEWPRMSKWLVLLSVVFTDVSIVSLSALSSRKWKISFAFVRIYNLLYSTLYEMWKQLNEQKLCWLFVSSTYYVFVSCVCTIYTMCWFAIAKKKTHWREYNNDFYYVSLVDMPISLFRCMLHRP